MNFEQEFVKKFGEKYQYLHLRDVVIEDNLCTITFLYSSTHETISDSDKQEIISWLESMLNLEVYKLKVKFMKAYVEEKLIRKFLFSEIEKKFKLLKTYVSNDDVQIKITNLDVQITFDVSKRISAFFAENKVSAYLAKVLKENFLCEFIIQTNIKEEKVEDVDISSLSFKPTYKATPRYEVMVIKKLIGKDIVPKPEYISNITAPKKLVVIAGYIDNLERKDFIVKSGKRMGQQKSYFTFTVHDRKGKMECIYFCGKTNLYIMEKLENTMFLLLHGDVRKGLSGKLQLNIDRISLASELEEKEVEEEKKVVYKKVEIEKLTTLEQDNLFGRVAKYNDKIMGKTYVVFDIETTGLSRDTDQITELSAVKIVDGVMIEKFSTLVKPTIDIPDDVIALTHITNEMVQDAPPIESVLQDFYEFTRGAILCGHNAIDFDLAIVKREAQNIGLDFDNPVVDTMLLARTSGLKIGRFNLGVVTKALGIVNEEAHRAWSDALATAEVLLKLNEINFKP